MTSIEVTVKFDLPLDDPVFVGRLHKAARIIDTENNGEVLTSYTDQQAFAIVFHHSGTEGVLQLTTRGFSWNITSDLRWPQDQWTAPPVHNYKAGESYLLLYPATLGTVDGRVRLHPGEVITCLGAGPDGAIRWAARDATDASLAISPDWPGPLIGDGLLLHNGTENA